jgi:3-dehydroquinate dehydratase-2
MTHNQPDILILNGPNLNLLGQREPEIYGHQTLAELDAACLARAQQHGKQAECRQTNDEGTLIEWVQQATAPAMIINAAAYTHTSVALHDALKNYSGRLVEVHLSNPHAREPFRHHSYLSPLAEAILCGMGARGYLAAIDYVCAGS